MAIINGTYPAQFLKLSKETKDAMINIWHELFAGNDYETVGNAVKNYIANDTSGYIPTIGVIKEYIRKSQYPDMMTEQEATNTIMAALSDGYYNSRKAFNSLDPILQRLVGSPEQIKAWSLMEIDTVQSVIMSNVSRSYRVLAEKEKVHQRTAPYNPNQIASTEEPKKIETRPKRDMTKAARNTTPEEATAFIRQLRESVGKINGK
jgi:hypothetical protein